MNYTQVKKMEQKKKAIPTKIVHMTVSTPNEMALSLMHPQKRTMVIYTSKDGLNTVSALRRNSKTWILVNGKVVRTTKIKELVQSINWA